MSRIRAIRSFAWHGSSGNAWTRTMPVTNRSFLAADLQRLYRRAGLVDIRIVPQGLLSMPFAEVILHPQAIMPGLAALACAIDAGLERRLGRRLQPFTWNVIAAGPAAPTEIRDLRCH